MYARRLNLNVPNNIRELGGYMRNDKKITKYKQFLRSDAIANLTENDINFLKEYGLKSIIDLRSVEEAQSYPNSFKNIDYVNYINLPLFDGLPSRKDSKEYIPLDKFYIEVIEFSKNIKNIFDIIADSKNNLVLFHCTVGKDRTGIISAILLMIAGIDMCDIISDYEISYTYVKSLFSKMAKQNYNVSEYSMRSKSNYIENMINYINTKYETIDKYLLEKGICKENINIIKNKLI